MKKGPNNLPWELHDPAPEPPVWKQPVDLSDHMPAENVLPRPVSTERVEWCPTRPPRGIG